MSIISQETWDKFTEEEKEKIRNYYIQSVELSENGIDEEERLINTNNKWQAEMYFGKENLQPQPKIKTWKDCQKMNEDSNFFMRITDNLELSDKVYSKCIATLKIAKLIELGYGGMVTEEEWCNDIIKHCAVRHESEIQHACMINAYEFIAFHTIDQYEEFMSYESNKKLVEQYYMI